MITSVDSLLVFKDDGKHGKSKTPSSSALVDGGSRKLEAAPVSITKGQSRPQVDDMFYTPTIDEAPELEFPMDIPDLAGVAGDISFTDDDFLAVVEQPQRPRAPVVQEVQPTVSVPVDTTPVPAPRVTIQETAPAISSIPPPPPPPMMMMMEPPQPSTTPKKDLPDATQARSNLMAAIRGAGGKLRSRAAADRVPEPKKKEKAEPVGDLMSDLRNRLSMRRKGISGAKNQVESDSLMGKISSMIPPPPMDTATEEQSDEDWN